MPTVTKTFLSGSSSDGFVQSGFSDWTSIYASSGVMIAYRTLANGNTTYSGTLLQGTTTNTYIDLGLPSNVKIVGIKFLGMSSSIVQDNNGFLNSATASFYTDEASFGEFNYNDFSEGDYVDVTSNNINSSDYVRFSVYISASTGIDFSESPSYGAVELRIDSFTIEFTYENNHKNNMFFAL